MTDRNLYIYQFHTTAGTIGILPDAGGRFKVLFDQQNLGSYDNPQAAVDDVSGGHTFSPSNGVELDKLGIPNDLGDWDKKLFAAVKGLGPS